MTRIKVFESGDIRNIQHQIRNHMMVNGQTIVRGEWQGKTDHPATSVFETQNVVISMPVLSHLGSWQQASQPNLPWAEDHFQERISGEPLNPGEQYKNWPWYKQGVEDHKETGQFSHSYMERFWPKFAPMAPGVEPQDHDYNRASNFGLRFPYGSYSTLLWLLRERPATRQAFLPIWFPEDLSAAIVHERVPCSLGYHFQLLNDQMNCTYFMRSCDFYRYLNDDVYMAGRLLQDVTEKVREQHSGIGVGYLTVHIANLHIFEAEKERMRREYDEETAKRYRSAY